jgi:hypothetical protein
MQCELLQTVKLSMIPFMADGDLINLRHDVDRHESDLDKQMQQIQSLEKERARISGSRSIDVQVRS